MANTKITALSADTSPTSDDLVVTVTDPAGTPANRKVTATNLITKAHGLSDGLLEVSSGVMGVATSGTDYAPATSGSGILKGNGSGGFSTATANTDYFAPKAKLDATTSPGAANDNTQGYAVGSIWVDVTGDKSYIAVDVSTGAAVWNDLTASAGGGISNVVEDLTPQLGGDLDLNSKNITAGAATVSPTELGYLDGVTSAIQTQFSGKQDSDADLTTIAGLTATTDNFMQAKSSAWASRTPTQVTADLITMVGDSGAGGTKGLVPAPASGDAAANKYLKADATWAAVSAGQSTYDAIVAATGGDYTTLGAAIAAAASGWSIFVKGGTYTESAITTSLTNLRIVGESRETTILDHSTNALAFSGVGVQFENIQFSMSTGRLTMSGAGQVMRNCKHIHSGAPSQPVLNATGANQLFESNWFESTSTASHADDLIWSTGANNKFIGCHFKLNTLGSSTGASSIEFNGNGSIIDGCTFEKYASGEGSGALIRHAAAQGVISNCTFYNWTATSTRLIIMVGNYGTIANCSFYGGLNPIRIEASYNTVANNQILNLQGSTGYGIYDATGNNLITGNIITQGSGTTRGVYLNGVARTTVTDNIFDGLSGAIELVNGTTEAHISGNKIYNCSNNILNTGTTTTGNIFNNYGTNPTEERVCVRASNNTGSTINAGDVVIMKGVSGGFEIATTTTAGDDRVFGVMQAAVTTGSIGYVQTTGKTVLLKVDGTTDIAINDFLTTFTTAGIAAKATAGDMVFAIALEAYTTNDSAGVIDALLINPRLI